MMRAVMNRRSIPCIVLLLGALFCAGCAAFVVELRGPAVSPESRRPARCETAQLEYALGVALSGGGSRAAVFAAAGLEALAGLWLAEGCSVLDRVGHVSSVSGGSIAASYFIAHKPTADSGSEQRKEFFAGMQQAMRANLGKQMEWRQAKKFRWVNPNKRALSMAEILDREFLDGITLGQVREKELRGELPRMLINSTWYHSGRRFVFTSLPAAALEFDLGDPQLDATTPADLGVNVNDLPLSTAVAASASLPWFIGPVTFVLGRGEGGAEQYLHAGDGGLSDNQGIETLIQALLSRSDEASSSRRALVVAFDGAQPFESGTDALLAERNKQFVQPMHVMTIMEERARAYSEIAMREGYDDRLEVILLRYHEARIAPEDLPPSCDGEGSDLDSSEKITRYLVLMPTRLSLRSDCDGDLLQLAAHRLVDDARERIERALGSM
jgi:hypothetical protein